VAYGGAALIFVVATRRILDALKQVGSRMRGGLAQRRTGRSRRRNEAEEWGWLRVAGDVQDSGKTCGGVWSGVVCMLWVEARRLGSHL
jgi:hypothetical protein